MNHGLHMLFFGQFVINTGVLLFQKRSWVPGVAFPVCLTVPKVSFPLFVVIRRRSKNDQWLYGSLNII